MLIIVFCDLNNLLGIKFRLFECFFAGLFRRLKWIIHTLQNIEGQETKWPLFAQKYAPIFVLGKNLFLEAHSFRCNQFFRSLNLADYFWKRTWISMKIYVPHYKTVNLKQNNTKFQCSISHFFSPIRHFRFCWYPLNLFPFKWSSFRVFMERDEVEVHENAPFPPPPTSKKKKKIMFICSTINPH